MRLFAEAFQKAEVWVAVKNPDQPQRIKRKSPLKFLGHEAAIPPTHYDAGELTRTIESKSARSIFRTMCVGQQRHRGRHEQRFRDSSQRAARENHAGGMRSASERRHPAP